MYSPSFIASEVTSAQEAAAAGRYDIAAPYTEEEHDMLKMAYKAIGSEFQDLNKGDLRSQEIPSTSTMSPVKSFKGYPR